MSIQVASGVRKRRSYAQIQEILELPNLIDVQRSSYEWFIEKGLGEIFQDISPIKDFTGNLVLEIFDYTLGEPKYSVDECKERCHLRSTVKGQCPPHQPGNGGSERARGFHG